MAVQSSGGGRLSPKAQAFVRHITNSPAFGKPQTPSSVLETRQAPPPRPRYRPMGPGTGTPQVAPKQVPFAERGLSPKQRGAFEAYYNQQKKAASTLTPQPRALKGIPPNIHLTEQQMGLVPATPTFARILNDAASPLLGIPAGLAMTGNAVYKDVSHGDLTMPRTRGIASAVVKATAQDIEHPLRHPGYTALDVLGLVSAGLGTAARASAAMGELGAAGSTLSRVGRAGLAVVRKPIMPERSLTYRPAGTEGVTAHPLPSQNPLGRVLQTVADKRTQYHLDHPPSPVARELKHIPSAHSRAIGRVQKELAQHDRYSDLIAQTPAMQALAAGKGLEPHEQLLMTTYHEGVHPAALAEAHKEWAAGSGDTVFRQQNLAQAALASKAHELITEHGPNWASLPPEQALPAHLVDRYKAGVAAGAAREQLMRDAGQPVSAERVQGPARVVAGAEYVKPTPGRLGVESQTLIKARAYQDRVAKLHETSLARDLHNAEKARAAVPFDAKAARSQLVGLDARFNKVVQQVHDEMFGPQTREDKIVQARRNMINGKIRKGGSLRAAREGVQPTIKSDQWRAAELEAVKRLEKVAPKSPEARRALGEVRQADTLRIGLAKNDPFGAQPSAKLIQRRTSDAAFKTLSPTSPRTEYLGSNLSMARERVQALEAAAAKRVTPIGMQGAEEITAGRGYVPHTARQRFSKSAGTAGFPRTAKSVGVPQRPPELSHVFTGDLLKSGGRRTDFTRLMGEAHLRAQHYFGQSLRLRDRVEKVVQATPDNIPAEHRFPVRLDKLKNHPFPRLVKQAMGEHHRPLSPDELVRLEDAHNNFLKDVFPFAGSKEGERGLSSPELAAFQKLHAEGKVGWVDKRILGKAGDTIPGSLPLTKTLATANNMIKGGMIYLNPGHVLTRNASNLGITATRQGVLLPVNMRRAARLEQTVGKEGLATVRAGMQGSASHALNSEQGLGKQALNVGAHMMHKLADQRWRDASFVHAARNAGYRTDAQLRDLLTNKANHDRLVEVFRTANDNAIDYGRLGPREKQIVSKAVFVYPWVKGSTRFAMQTAVHHPATAMGLQQVGRQGEQFSNKTLGPVPSYLEGAFGLGGKLVQPDVANPFGTAGHVMHMIGGALTGKATQADQVASLTNPAIQLGLTAATGHTSLGKSTLGQGLPGVLSSQLEQQFPLVQFGKRFTQGPTPDKLFSYSPAQAVGRLAFGAPFPRTYNKTILGQQAMKDKLSVLAPADKVKYQTSVTLQQLPGQFKQLQKMYPKDPRFSPDNLNALQASYQRVADRRLAYIQAAGKLGVSTSRLPKKDRLLASISAAQKYGYPTDQAKQLTATLTKAYADPHADPSAVDAVAQTYIDWFSKNYFPSTYQNQWKKYVVPMLTAKKP